jgi:hypothetical protein
VCDSLCACVRMCAHVCACVCYVCWVQVNPKELKLVERIGEHHSSRGLHHTWDGVPQQQQQQQQPGATVCAALQISRQVCPCCTPCA